MRYADPATRLSGFVLNQLCPEDQFLLWAIRRRTRDGVPGSELLIEGFRQAFGLAHLEAALAEFEGVFGVLARPVRDLGLCPLTSACVSHDEAAILSLGTTPRSGWPCDACPAAALVGAFASSELERRAGRLRARLAEAHFVPRMTPCCTRRVLH